MWANYGFLYTYNYYYGIFCLQATVNQKGILWASFSVALLYMTLVFMIAPYYDLVAILVIFCLTFGLMFIAAWSTRSKY